MHVINHLGSNFDDSDDSNAEDNWRNEYPDELDEFDDDDIYGFKDEDDALGKYIKLWLVKIIRCSYFGS